MNHFSPTFLLGKTFVANFTVILSLITFHIQYFIRTQAHTQSERDAYIETHISTMYAYVMLDLFAIFSLSSASFSSISHMQTGSIINFIAWLALTLASASKHMFVIVLYSFVSKSEKEVNKTASLNK